jgi:hypothetical protein
VSIGSRRGLSSFPSLRFFRRMLGSVDRYVNIQGGTSHPLFFITLAMERKSP